MSNHKVTITTVQEVITHPNADKLCIYRIYGWHIIGAKDKYNIGDKVVYISIDSILSLEVEKIIFGPDSKIKLHKSRVRQIKIRGVVSEGLIGDPVSLGVDHLPVETNVSEILNIKKHEPELPSYQANSGPLKRDKPKENPYFHKYGGLDNAKWYPTLFEPGEPVSITCKIHGSHIRCGWAPVVANTWYKKLLNKVGLLPSHEWVYGSNNVQLQKRTGWFRNYKGYYGGDVYGAALKKAGIKEKLKPGEMLYGELYGDGIQKDYNYGCKAGEHKLVWFDLKMQTETSSEYLSPNLFRMICKERDLACVPELYNGPYISPEHVKSLTVGDSILCPSQKVREGVVIKPLTETPDSVIGRKVLKVISEKYLEGDQSDYH
jgi:RNA ligase (TIGR02306 family)